MTTLHLGIVEVPYVEPPAPTKKAPKARKGKRKAKAKRGAKGGGHQAPTTGDVATFLENKYHIMEVFYEDNQQQIADLLAQSMTGAMENIALRAPLDKVDPYISAQSAIETLFRDWLTSRKIESAGIPGVPTKAALEGISHRFKNKRGPRRPSFIDTGLYEANFADWVE